jgi:hypothetical protein
MRSHTANIAALLTAAVLACVAVAPARAADPPSKADLGPGLDPRAAQVAAAQANGLAALRASILRLEVGRGLRVGDVVARTGSDDILTHALAGARPLGGPRWVDDQTCQVQVTVSGGAVADAVVAMAGRYPGGRLPVRGDALTAKLSAWRATAFAATGSSVAGGTGLQQARPQLVGRWADVPDAVRARAVADAQADAVRQLQDQLTRAIAGLPVGNNTLATDVLARPTVAARVHAYLDGQPVTTITFGADLTVSLTMTLDARSLAVAFESAAADEQPQAVAAAARAGDWDRVAKYIERGVRPTVTGTASAAPVAAVPGVAAPPNVAAGLGRPPPGVTLPAQPPPGWVDGLEADGSAVAVAGRHTPTMKVVGSAQSAAVGALRDKLLAMRINPTSTLGDAVRADPELSAAVSRVLLGARDSRVDYQADGSVHVRVYLNLHDAWEQLQSNP